MILVDKLYNHCVPPDPAPGPRSKVDPVTRAQAGAFAGRVGIALNIALSAAKGTVGLTTGSVSIVADALNNLTDASSNIVSLVGFKLASRPADEGHPYGHGRYEYLAGLVVAVSVLYIGIELVRSSIERLFNPEPTLFTVPLVIVMAASVAVKLWMAKFNATFGDRLSSEALRATAADSRNDAIATAAVLLGAVLSWATGSDLDPWCGIAVGAYVAWSGWGLVRDAVSPLLGDAPDPDLVQTITDRVLAQPGVLGIHDLQIHDYGPGRTFASAHVELSAKMPLLDSHETLDEIERTLRDRDGVVVTLHCDPVVTDDPAVRRIRGAVKSEAAAVDPRISVQDFRIVPGGRSGRIFFEATRPIGCDLTAEQLKDRLTRVASSVNPQAQVHVTVDEEYASTPAPRRR